LYYIFYAIFLYLWHVDCHDIILLFIIICIRSLYRNVINYFCFTGESIGSLLGGYLFDTYGGVWSFRFFSYMSVVMCFLSIVTNYFGLTRESITSKDNAESTNTDLKITNKNTDKKMWYFIYKNCSGHIL